MKLGNPTLYATGRYVNEGSYCISIVNTYPMATFDSVFKLGHRWTHGFIFKISRQYFLNMFVSGYFLFYISILEWQKKTYLHGFRLWITWYFSFLNGSVKKSFIPWTIYVERPHSARSIPLERTRTQLEHENIRN